MNAVVTEYRACLINGRERHVNVMLWSQLTGPKPPAHFDCNGCSYSPDYVLGHAIWPACVIHDWHYHDGGPDISLSRANVVFARNVWTCMRYSGANWFVASWAASSRYAAVTRLGKWFFKMKGA